jgi:cyclophilin family peptidyl-prolyl cis-trans isomerase
LDRRPQPEILEDRRLLTASLQPISNLTVPAQQGYTLPLNGSGTTDAQTFTVTSSNPDIAASIPTGPFWTINVQYTDASNPANNFSLPLTFQLFQDLTPSTVAHIQEFSNDGYYTGKHFTRVASGFPGATDYVVQGGAPNPDGTGNSGQPGTPFANENLQQLAFTGTDQLGMANAGGTNSNDVQFFITTGSPNSELGYNYTIFGQMVSGQNTLAMMTNRTIVPVQANPVLGGEVSQPVNPLIMSSVALSNSNPNGVVVLDTTQAKQGETSTVTVTATDPTDGSHVSQSFTVTVGAYTGPTTTYSIRTINFKPLAYPTTATTATTTLTTVTLNGQGTLPVAGVAQDLTYSLVSQPSHGMVSNFNATAGTFTYTPSPGFVGTDTFQYTVSSSGPNPSAPAATSNPATVTITVTPTPTPTPTPPPLVTLSAVREVTNKKHQVRELLATFSGAVNAAEADDPALYRLATAGKKGSFTAKNAKVIKLKSAAYDSTDNTVILIPRKPFALTKPVQLQVSGLPPSGLQDSSGRFIDGDHNGTAGGNAVAILSRGGVTIDAMTSGSGGAQPVAIAAVSDALFEGDEQAGMVPALGGRGALRLGR